MSTPKVICVNTRQKDNPLLKHIRNVAIEYDVIVPDYVISQNVCALYLSLRYHQLNPDYIHDRLKQLSNMFAIRILLLVVDVKMAQTSLKEFSKMSLIANFTLIVAYSLEEAARYLETYKIYENKAADDIMPKENAVGLEEQVCEFLSSIKCVNKTNAATLLDHFQSLQAIVNADATRDFSLCPGFGSHKAKLLHDFFNTPFLNSNS